MEKTFEDIRNLLIKEINNYKGDFLKVYQQKTEELNENNNSKIEEFDKKINSEMETFNQLYIDELDHLKHTLITTKTNYDNLNRDNSLQFDRHSENITNSTVNTMLKQTYAIRVKLDKMDDFLKNKELEDRTKLNKKILEFKHILDGESSMEEDIKIFKGIFMKIVGSLPPSEKFEDLYPLVIGMLSQVNNQNISMKTLYLTNTNDFDSNLENYIRVPDIQQMSNWKLICDVFRINKNLNMRLYNHIVNESYSEERLQLLMLIHLINKYRTKVPFIPANPEVAKQLYNYTSDSNVLDKTLVDCPTYYSPEGIQILFQRYFGNLFLNYNKDKDTYYCDLSHTDNLKLNEIKYYNYGGYLEFDKNLTLLRIEIDSIEVYSLENNFIPDNDIIYKRVLASLLTLATWSIHLGLNHCTVGDDWNYKYAENVYKYDKEHPLNAIIKPVTTGVAEGVNLASLILVNNLPTSIASCGNNIMPSDISKLCLSNIMNIDNYLHYPTIKKKQNNLNTDMNITLEKWWDIIESFVKDYVSIYYNNTKSVNDDMRIYKWLESLNRDISLEGLISTISIMYFNQVVHELFSNPQLINDFFENKLFLCINKETEDGIPSAMIHNRSIESLIGTNGGTLRFVSYDFSVLVKDNNENAKDAFRNFRKNLIKFSEEFETNSNLVKILNPKYIESSTAW